MDFDEFMSKLELEKTDSYLGLNRDYELEYMETAKQRLNYIFHCLPDSLNSLKVLDIGTSPFTFFIKESYPHYQVATLDLTNLLQARCEMRGIEFKRCDLAKETIPFHDNYFDVVVFSGVLEHLFTPPTKVLREIWRIMREGGLLVFCVPNFLTLRHRIECLAGISPLQYSEETMAEGWVHGYGHIHEYTMKESIYLLKSCNFIIGRKKFHSPSVFQPFTGATKWKPSSLVKVIYLILCFIVPQFRGTIIVECYKP